MAAALAELPRELLDKLGYEVKLAMAVVWFFSAFVCGAGLPTPAFSDDVPWWSWVAGAYFIGMGFTVVAPGLMLVFGLMYALMIVAGTGINAWEGLVKAVKQQVAPASHPPHPNARLPDRSGDLAHDDGGLGVSLPAARDQTRAVRRVRTPRWSPLPSVPDAEQRRGPRRRSARRRPWSALASHAGPCRWRRPDACAVANVYFPSTARRAFEAIERVAGPYWE